MSLNLETLPELFVIFDKDTGKLITTTDDPKIAKRFEDQTHVETYLPSVKFDSREYE